MLQRILFVPIVFLVFTLSPAQETTIFTSQTPSATGDDRQYELGTRFMPLSNGYVTRVRIYTMANEGGTHTIRLWQRVSTSYSLIAGPIAWSIQSGTAGWKEHTLATAVSVTANTEYIISVSNSTDNVYAKAPTLFNNPLNNQYISTYTGSGVYSTTLGSAPTSVYQNSSYFRDIVFVPASPIPPDPPAVQNQSFCGNTIVSQLTGTAPTNCVIEWFSASTGGTALSQGVILSTGTYYAGSRNTLSGALSVTRNAAVITVNDVPGLPIAVNQTFAGTVTVADLTGTPSSGCVIEWYTASTGGNALAATTPLATGTYYAESRNSTSGCRSAGRTSISVTVNTIPDAPVVSAQTFCGSATVAQLTGSAPAGCIIDWYAAASGGVALAPTALVATTTYFAQSRNISTGLVSLTRTAKTVSVVPNPDPPTVANQNFNGSATVANLAGTAPGGCVIDWFTSGTGGTSLPGSVSLTTGTYFAASRDLTAGCTSTSRVSVTVTVNALPAPPTVGAQSFCGSATVSQLTGSAPAGCVIDWYAAPTGGSALGAGFSLTSGVYYAESRNTTTGTTSATRASAVITINQLPAVATASNQVFNFFATIADLTGTAPAGCVIDWFRSATGGAAEPSTSVLNAGSYFAESRNSSNGCVSSARASINVTINQNVTDNYSIFTQQTPATSGNDRQYELGTVFTVQANGTIPKVRLYTVVNETGVHTVRIWRLSGGTYTLASGPHSWNITSTSAGWNEFDLPSPVVVTSGTTCIVAISNSSNFIYPKSQNFFNAPISNSYLTAAIGAGVYSTTLGTAPTASYMNSCYFRDVVFVPQQPIAPAAPTVTAQAFCGNSTVANLGGTAPANCVIDWYAAASGGAALAGTTSLFSGTYFAESRNTFTGLLSGSRSASSVAVNQSPEMPNVQNQTFTTNATVGDLAGTPPPGAVIEWFGAATGGAPLAATVSLSSGIYYSGSRIAATGCVSASRAACQVSVLTNPEPPVVPNQSFCGGATISQLSGTAPAGCVIDWFTTASGGVALAGTVPVQAGFYYAESRSTVTGLVSATRSSKSVAIIASPPPPNVSNQSYYVQSTIASLRGSAPVGCTIDWFATETGGTALSGTTVLTATGTLYAESRNTTIGCLSISRSPAQITILPNTSLHQEFSIFSNQNPEYIGNDNRYELGTRFSVTVNGLILKVRVYASAIESGDHTVRIWRLSGSDYSLISGPYSWNITAGTSGWKEFDLPTPVNVFTGTEYIVAVSNGPDNQYPVLQRTFQSPLNNEYITTFQGSGVYSAVSGAVPLNVHNNSCYFRDIVFVPDSLFSQPDTTVLPDTISHSVLVLVNSSSVDYAAYSNNLKLYLDHFGIPYFTVDVSRNQLPNLNNFALIILAHNNVYSTGYPIAQLEASIAGGIGFLCFDQHFFDFGSSFSESQTARSINGPIIAINQLTPAHYINRMHTPDPAYNPNNDRIQLRQSLPVTTTSRLVNGRILAEVSDGTNPLNNVTLLEAAPFNNGRVVRWNSSSWMSDTYLGPLYGMDDLLWRGIVWAAKKPFVMQGLPSFLTMRIDDVDGTGNELTENFQYVNICNNFGIRPWLGTFNDQIPPVNISTLRGLLANSNATAFPHAFSRDNFIYYNYYNVNGFDPVANWERALSFFRVNNLPLSNFLVPHYYNLNTAVLPGIKNAGCDFVGIQTDPGDPYGGPWMNCGPFRLNRDGSSRDIRPLYYAGAFAMNGIDFFNCVTEIRDDAGYEWAPSEDVVASSGRGIRQVRRALNGMALATLFTHENDYIDYITTENWTLQIQAITADIAEYFPIYTTMDYAVRYVRAKTNIKIKNVIPRTATVDIYVSGTNDMPTKCYLFTESSGVITHSLVDIPLNVDTATVHIPRP